MKPEEIEQHGRNVRRKLNRIFENSSYKNFGPIPDIFSAADDLCELVIALAENAKAAESALPPPPSVTVTVEQQSLAKDESHG
jgi:hypothetical protein